ncbi:DNA polymerase zeta catalytic subunit [Dichanthelium oligosanthes]|uniref:DNA polymerase n=1 Tax=Dichanthelium oligosanthes TaxID=888268 RepID=A0A1E5VXQ6_9POAL|nr:DNA polymerase zeta catalytic subunit [Dichanthelium oligosanthes]
MSQSPEPSTPGTPTPVLSVRIVSIDYYMAPPLPGFDFSRSPFHGEEVDEVPVIRIYGSTPAGQKTCLHVHRVRTTQLLCLPLHVLPYLYIPCPEELLYNLEKGNSYITGLLSGLEKALQSGAISNRAFQPYESHIPYLLHFLIDYNLYGMGHIHVKDFKFRPPLPDDFRPKSSLRRKAQSNNSEIKSPTVWISSTVPHSSILGSSAASRCLGGTSLSFASRHSSSMLEADSRVEGILNEKYKMYTSLSQTTEDTKMVQSLVAIWEEIERLRLLDETKYADLCRPLREEVLKDFLHGIKYESALSMLFSQEEPHLKVSTVVESERLERCFKSLTDIVGAVTFSQDDYCDDNDVGNSAGMQNDKQNASLCSESLKQIMQTISPDRNSEYLESSSVAQRTLSQLSDEGEKQVDAEALGLLRWLAYSQAAEEPTTDDELINEVILSPLFAKKSIEVALESAHLDFDSASQQECQDILDSIDPVGAAEEPTTHTSYLNSVNPNSTASVGNTIPQVDGSSDENPKVSQEYDRSKLTRKAVGSPSYTPTKNSSKSASKRAGTEHLWGSLPFSRKKRTDQNADDSCSAMPSQKDLSGSNKSTAEKNYHDTTGNTDGESSSFVGVHGSVCHSVRDLMRRRRSFRHEQLEFGNSGAATCTSDKESETVNSGGLKFHDFTIDVPNSAMAYSGDECLRMTFAQKPPLKNHVCSGLESPPGCEQRECYLSYDEGVPADNEEARSSTLSPNSPTRSASEHSTTKVAVDGDVMESILSNKESKHLDECHDFSQISAEKEKDKLTPLSQIGFRDPASIGGGQQLTIFSMEVLTESRGELRPDPRFDAINAVSLAIEDDADNTVEVHVFIRDNSGKSRSRRNLDGIAGCNVDVFPEERDLLNNLISTVCSIDPDILVGWEIQLGSLGFLAERAAYLGIGLLKRISRTPPHEVNHPPKVPVDDSSQVLAEATSADDVIDDVSENDWSHTHASGIHVGGRIVLNLWRLMRAEVKLNNYSLEAVADEVLRRKMPLIPNRILNRWFATGPGRGRHRCIEYISNRARINLEIMNQLDLVNLIFSMVNRTSELARVFGIDFFSVLSRGSQYRVESMLLRLAHTQNYLAISPGNQQVASQPAMECLPLVMEPESAFYPDPVVVLDFQSLYPSMIIAYNLCYSTCLGKVFPSKSNVLGVSSYSADPHTLVDLKNQMLLTPNGVLYVQPEVMFLISEQYQMFFILIRKGALPRLLEEILSTRIMVKQAMKKLGPSEQVLHRIFNARQLALKLIANVTYGYTAAGFSGRMPCAELADSIVQCGRRTLETAISFVNQHPLWKARVVYGDTDSMFVLLKGRSREEAFRIGKEIASSISAINPDPVTLKFEKVYQPCFLLTKKRYVGYSYESPDQNEPVFDAKGIETVRRDTCPAVAKILERSIRIMFEEQDLTKVRSYLERQWTRILSGKVSIRDFIFAKEVRLGTYSARASTLPPAAIVATKAMLSDPRAEPRYAERVPYVVIHGEPGARLVDMVIDPYGLLEVGSPYRLNELYYITKQIIPALQRVFGLLGADLNKWFNEMPRPIRPTLAKRQSAPGHGLFSRDGSFIRLGLNNKACGKGGRIDTYYMSSHCSICSDLIQGSDTFCENCLKNEAVVATVVAGRTSKLEREIQHLAAICGHCGGADWIVESGVKCISLACPVFYERRKIQRELRVVSESAGEAGYYPFCCAELF